MMCGLSSIAMKCWHPQLGSHRSRDTGYLGAGIEVADLRLDVTRYAEAELAAMFFAVREASVAGLQVELPGWRAPLVLRARGIRLVLQQRNMPEVRSCKLI
jgi:hypothetical protein